MKVKKTMTILFAFILSIAAFQSVSSAEEDLGFTPGGGDIVIDNNNNSIAFTPSGSATVIDNVIENNGKEFYTITTESGNVFYLIVDRFRDSNNVYFLNAVTEKDLLALAKISGEIIKETTNTDANSGGENAPEQQSKPETTPTENSGLSSNTTTVIFVGIAVVAVAITGFYVKIIKPKKQGNNDDFDDFEDCEEEDNYSDNDEGEPDFERGKFEL